MSYPKKGEVQSVLDEFHPRIRRVVERAWAEWRAVEEFRADNTYGAILYSRTVANYVFDAIARHAILEFGPDDSVLMKIEAQTVKFVFKGKVVARFKKGDDHKLGQNIATHAVSLFVDPDEMFPDFPPSTAKVDLIWLANDLNTRLEHVLVVARDNDRLIWEYEIEPVAEDAVVPFPTAAASSEERDVADLVTPKLPASESQDEEAE